MLEFREYRLKCRHSKFVGTVLGESILRLTDNLSKALQGSTLSAAEGQKVADMTLRTICTLRNDESFDLFWLKVTDMATKLHIA